MKNTLRMFHCPFYILIFSVLRLIENIKNATVNKSKKKIPKMSKQSKKYIVKEFMKKGRKGVKETLKNQSNDRKKNKSNDRKTTAKVSAERLAAYGI